MSAPASGPVPVLINAGGGTAARMGDTLEPSVRAAFDRAGVTIDLHLIDGCDMQEAVAKRAHLPVVVVGGGDGTIGCAAGEVRNGKAALGILPLGTRNHLARELDIPLDLDEAARVIAKGDKRQIDVARVNDHFFINNASIGLYPAMVREREEEQEAHGLPKWIAAIPASWTALKRLRHHSLRLRTPAATREVRTPMLFVGNNHYSLEAGRIGKRDALNDGRLSVFALASRGRAALIGFALRAAIGKVKRQEDFAAIGDVPELTVTGRSDDVDIALDGEVRTLTLPLEFRVDPGALTVIAPPLAPQA
ncbi:sphingosine kinase [Sphingomonas aliaeris]|uniref:Sphingosine kinase n=1 Tax=Sphingomonas aliaeris TaxID=2759526 RepID=A0A974NXG1_9SPHN|nr:diacylglycerol kinase family protein [Sphingomonas aliaeris]QQV78720.1 sphingosine kinase [Sphingomonas aliaeris]